MNKPTWKTLPRTFSGLFAVAILAGCATAEVAERQQFVTERLARPTTIWVTDFVANAAEIPPDSVLRGERELDTTPQTAAQASAGRQLGAAIAAQLVEEIRGMGLPAARATVGTQTRVNDILLRGYLLSVKEGSAAKRVAIGFGSGASELRTLVEGFQATATGFRKLGSGTVDASGNKTPGAALGVATFLATANPVGLIVSSGMKVSGEVSGSSTVEGRARATAKLVADQLRVRFRENGWIQ